MSEKLTGADHTKLDDQFSQMEKITDAFLEVEVRTDWLVQGFVVGLLDGIPISILNYSRVRYSIKQPTKDYESTRAAKNHPPLYFRSFYIFQGKGSQCT